MPNMDLASWAYTNGSESTEGFECNSGGSSCFSKGVGTRLIPAKWDCKHEYNLGRRILQAAANISIEWDY